MVSALVNIIVFTVAVIVTIIVLTIYIYYRRSHYSCDASPFFYCYTDWKCDNGTNNALNERVTDLTCHLKALYGALTDADDCPGFNNRDNPCSKALPEADTNQLPAFCSDGQVSSTYTDAYNSCSCNNGANVNAQFSKNWTNVANEPNSSCTGPDCYNPNTVGCNLFPNKLGVCTS